MPHAILGNPGLDTHPVQQAIEMMIAGRERLAELLDETPTTESATEDNDEAVRQKLVAIVEAFDGLPTRTKLPNSVLRSEAFHLLFHVLRPATFGLVNTPPTRANEAAAIYLAHLVLKDLENS